MTAAVSQAAPHDLDAERAVLGACLLASSAYADAAGVGLTSADFFVGAHASVWDAVGHLVRDGSVAEPVAVADRLRSQGQLDAVGGLSALLALQAAPPGPATLAAMPASCASRRYGALSSPPGTS